MSVELTIKQPAPANQAGADYVSCRSGREAPARRGLSMNSGLVASLPLRRCREVLAFVDYRIEVPRLSIAQDMVDGEFLSGCTSLFICGGWGEVVDMVVGQGSKPGRCRWQSLVQSLPLLVFEGRVNAWRN